MKLTFEREWPVPPPTAWPYLTRAAHMNQWSEATIIAQLEGAAEGSVGSHRDVLVRALGATLRLHETVTAVEAPHAFEYRVTPGRLLRRHRGTIRLGPTDRGTRLTWEVEFEATMPGASALLGLLLRPMMERSLDALGAILSRQAAPGAGEYVQA